jgi:carbon monoxide dehydrogenase subunit G
MIRLEGDRQLPFPPAETFAKLRDARFLVTCIQGSSATGDPPTEDQAQCVVRPNVPFMRGSMIVTLKVVKAEAPTLLRIQVLGAGTNVSSEVDTELNFRENQGGTHIRWLAEVKKLGGTLNVVPANQVQAAAQRVTQEVWALLSTRIDK